MQEGPTARDFLTLLGLSLIWGSSYVLIKWGLDVFTARQVAVLRLGLSAIALAPLAITHLRRVRLGQIPLLIVVGLTGTALPAFLFPVAQMYLSSSLTGMLSSLVPLCTFLVAWLVFRDRPAQRQVIGIALGLLGAIALAYYSPGGQGGTQQLLYAGLVLLACFCYGTSANLVANYFQDVPALTITVVSYFLVGLPALVYAVAVGEVIPTVVGAGHAGAMALLYVSILAVGSTVLAGLVYYRLVQRTGAVFASTVSYLIPVVALLWGVVDGEGVVWIQVPAIALVLVGVFMSKRS
ncbi:hypothetical protein LEM8419_02485 [Neolewinella maritima]|uniref:EamA domain-containing protein n=1 Tax=Neolewinella maritima TaxID=1383882 RepID=A0ABN8F6B7_9BACT|nr:DMT family transporter [Neolewinella maritima]CAH1001582.1 hypothetical protein LEM8419_02485 [Neolewinella maritima]